MLRETARIDAGQIRDSDFLCRWAARKFGSSRWRATDRKPRHGREYCAALTGALVQVRGPHYGELRRGAGLVADDTADTLFRRAERRSTAPKQMGRNRCGIARAVITDALLALSAIRARRGRTRAGLMIKERL